MGRGHNASLDPIKTNRLYTGLFIAFHLAAFHSAISIRSRAAARLVLWETTGSSATSSDPLSRFDTTSPSVSDAGLFGCRQRETRVPAVQAPCRTCALAALRRNPVYDRTPMLRTSDLSRSLLRKRKDVSPPTHRGLRNRPSQHGSSRLILLLDFPECDAGVRRRGSLGISSHPRVRGVSRRVCRTAPLRFSYYSWSVRS